MLNRDSTGETESRRFAGEFLENVLVPALESSGRAKLDLNELVCTYMKKRKLAESEFGIQDILNEVNKRIVVRYDPGPVNPETLVRAYNILTRILEDTKELA